MASVAKVSACAIERSDHNYYMFSVFQRECMDPAYLDDINNFWKTYAGQEDNGQTDFYKWNKEEIMAIAKKKGDAQMVAYLRLLNRYIKVCESVAQDSWDYPSKQELAQRQQSLLSILNAAKAYKGTRMKSMYALLRMRASMMLGQDKANANYWTTTASKLMESRWKEAMRNIYARSLIKDGMRMKACDIYASQGDMTSIKWVARKYRNLAGIESIYASNPNAPTLNYLVQDFVNNVQQTIDLKPKTEEEEVWLKEIGAKAIYKDEAQRFIAFANRVVAEGKTSSPCLWRSSTAMLHYLMGDYSKALTDIEQAQTMEGTQRMKDNARAIKFLTLTARHELNAQFSEYLVKEMEWIDSKIKEDRGNGLNYANHYTNVKERITFRNLVPLFISQGKPNMATAIMGMMQKYENSFTPDAAQYTNKAYGNYSDYTCLLDTLKADATLDYYNFLITKTDDAFEQYVKDRVYADADFFNEMIGTKYICEGKFDEAATFLKKVSQQFINGQRISFYMAQRSYNVPRWFVRQKAKDEEGFLYTDFADAYAHVDGNQKLQYCQDMSQMLHKYNLSREGAEKEQLAYQLAVSYYQASCYGDCWYLTHYGKSVADSARTGELDFAAEAMKYLKVCTQSSNTDLRYKATYALAFMPIDQWYTIDYDTDYNAIIRPITTSAQYQALAALDRFALQYPEAIDHYTSNCDVLKQFREKR